MTTEGNAALNHAYSGAGKSTLLHILGTLDRPDGGIIYYGGENIFSLSDDKLAKFRNKNIGFVFQFHHLLPEFTAVENVAIPQMIGGVSKNAALIKAEELLIAVGLEERINHKPAELSGGEQQRIAVARALANDPSIIFADEPTGNLDSANSKIPHNILIVFVTNMEKHSLLLRTIKNLLDLQIRFTK